MIHSLQPSLVPSPPHKPMTCLPHVHKWPFQAPYQATLLLSSIGSPWFSERANRNWRFGFRCPICFYIIPYVCKSALLAACLMLVSCLALSSTLKIKVTCSSEMLIHFQQINGVKSQKTEFLKQRIYFIVISWWLNKIKHPYCLMAVWMEMFCQWTVLHVYFKMFLEKCMQAITCLNFSLKFAWFWRKLYS